MNTQPETITRATVIGLVPAAGRGTRIAPLPFSKELYPVGFRHTSDPGAVRPKVACHYLLEKMHQAGITTVYLIIREGKWDIPAYLRDGALLDMHIGYLMMGLPFGAPYTLDQAYPFVRNMLVAFGFPDIIFQSGNAFGELLSRQTAGSADLVLGLFPTDHPHKVDMADVDDNGRVRGIVIKPYQTALRYTWGLAVWTPAFTQFLHEFVARHELLAPARPELSVGEVIHAAIGEGLPVEAVQVSDTPYLDIGTPEDLVKAVQRFAAQ